MKPNMPTASLTPAIEPIPLRPSSDLLRDALERSVAAKLVAMLPPDDEAAERILRHAAALYQGFVSIEACRQARAVEG
jgi:hypothetical protein